MEKDVAWMRIRCISGHLKEELAWATDQYTALDYYVVNYVT